MRYIPIALCCAFLATSLPAQKPELAAEAAAPAPRTASKDQMFFWFRMWPDLLVKYDPVSDKEILRVKSKHGVAHGTYLSHDQTHIFVLTGQRTTVEVVDLAQGKIVEEHSFAEDGWIIRVSTVKEIPGYRQWYVKIDRVRKMPDQFVIEEPQWLLYDLEKEEVVKRMKELPKAIRSGARISPCGKKWHVFSSDLKIVDPKTLKEEASIPLSVPRFSGAGPLRVRGTDLFHHRNPKAYRLLYTMSDPVKTSRTLFGLVDIDLENNRISKVSEWGFNPPVWNYRLSEDGTIGIGQISSRGSRGRNGGERDITLASYDMRNGHKIREQRSTVRTGLWLSAVSPDGKKCYLSGRGHELVIFDEKLQYLKTIEMSGELEGTIFVVHE